jgi:hypothetical protein
VSCVTSMLEKVSYGLAGILGALIIGYAVAYWWTTRVPSRPRGVREGAVFLWAPAVGLPAPRRGDWLACWNEAQHTFCELDNLDGSYEYKGEFISYPQKNSVETAALKVDPEKTRETKVWIGGALVPLVHLQNGSVLLPAEKFDESARLLQH